MTTESTTETSGQLRREDFLSRVSARRYINVVLHDGTTVMLRSVTEAEACTVDMRELSKSGETDRNRLRERRLATLTVHLVDAQTKQRMFGFEDIAQLRNLDAADVNVIFDACVKLREGRSVDAAEKPYAGTED